MIKSDVAAVWIYVLFMLVVTDFVHELVIVYNAVNSSVVIKYVNVEWISTEMICNLILT
jgi:hypothetical protein